MVKRAIDGPSQAEALVKKVPALFFLVRQGGAYKVGRRWGIFDTLAVRVVDDLTFAEGESTKAIVAFTEIPPHSSDIKAIEIPTQVALERIFFHIQGVSRLVVNPREEVAGLAAQQQGIECSVSDSLSAEVSISRAEIPEILGAFALPKRKVVDIVERGERALRKNSLFEALCLARRAKRQDAENHRPWFVELMALSFMGLPDEALALYEQYILRGSSEPEAQLVAARFRLLLRQYNEARTILHTLTFNENLGAIASCELARSFVASGEFDRAIDLATSAIQKDSTYLESHLVRGIAQRGLSYPVGDEDGMRDALQDLEKVAHAGGFSAPEALFHAGTIFGRLGALEQAEIALRQSLFQRDRYASRDALVRVLCAAKKFSVAREELKILSGLAPSVTKELRKEIQSHLADPDGGEGARASALWSPEIDVALKSARESLHAWRVPIQESLQDFAIVDDFINRYAPAGEFMAGGARGHLHDVGVAPVGRAIALHLGGLLVSECGASWDTEHGAERISVISKRGARLPLEAFVHERVLLGASGDNFSSLESLVGEAQLEEGVAASLVEYRSPLWHEAGAKEVEEFQRQADWAREKLVALGAELTGSLRDLEEIDLIIERAFEPGGVVQEVAKPLLGGEVERFVVGLGLLVGSLIARNASATYFTHELPEGFSLVVSDLGRVFPVARVQRRVYLSSAADPTATLSGFAFGVAAAIMVGLIRSGVYRDRPHVITAFKEMLPRVSEFSDAELEGVVDALFMRGRRDQ
jgi:tetratricopeptide (TPR) repeat protein